MKLTLEEPVDPTVVEDVYQPILNGFEAAEAEFKEDIKWHVTHDVYPNRPGLIKTATLTRAYYVREHFDPEKPKERLIAFDYLIKDMKTPSHDQDINYLILPLTAIKAITLEIPNQRFIVL